MVQAKKPAKPVEISKEGDHSIRIKWDDGHEGVYPNTYLRQKCRCAACVEEWTGRVLIDPNSIAKDIRAVRISPVGLYAIHIQWSDGHDTGIYAFDMLREICPCAQCAAS